MGLIQIAPLKKVTPKKNGPSPFAYVYEGLAVSVNGLFIGSGIFHISCGNAQFVRQCPQVSVCL
jgi:hypothetical protein